MSDSFISKRSIPAEVGQRLFVCALFLILSIPSSFGQTAPLTPAAQQTAAAPLAPAVQQPPLDFPANRLPATDPNAISAGGWLLYPTLRVYSLYSDNVFFTPVGPLAAGAIGVTPSMVAVWSNGIHTTTLYGNIDRQDYPTANEVNTIDGRAGFTQKYEAMRDLIFTANIDYFHQTWATGLQNSIQAPPTAPTTSVLPNGNTVLPNGTILSPSGQQIGQTTATAASGTQLLVNPSNQYTGTFSVDKIFNRGIINLSASVNRTDFENSTAAQRSFDSRTFSERAAFWLGPLLFAYSNGSVSTLVTDATFSSDTLLPSIATTSYRMIGGLGTRQSELIYGSVYFGHQASEGGGTTAGGDVYGAALTYSPTNRWALAATVDRTINIASQPSAANLALTLPGLTAEQVPIGSSTVITSTGVRLSYEITRQWLANLQMGYSRVDFVDSSRLDNGWIVDAKLRYDIWRNMSLTWEYRYTSILSNAPLASATSNTGIIGAIYKF